MTDAPRLQGPGCSNSPEPFAGLVKQLEDIRRRLNDVQSAVLKSAGLKAEPNLLRVLGDQATAPAQGAHLHVVPGSGDAALCREEDQS